MPKISILLVIVLAFGLIATGCGKNLPTRVHPEKTNATTRAVTGRVVLGPGGALGDFVWQDLDANGRQDPAEPGINGAVLTLVPLGQTDAVQGEWVTKTDAKGHYEFVGVTPGTYQLTVQTPDGCEPTKSFATKPELDSNGSPATVKVEEAFDPTIDFGFLCKTTKECGVCDGGVTALTLRYEGRKKHVRVRVIAKKTRKLLFEGRVERGESFSFEIQSRKGGRPGEIVVEVNSERKVRFDTDCSAAIGPGLVRGSFEVVSGTSRYGGALCPVK